MVVPELLPLSISDEVSINFVFLHMIVVNTSFVSPFQNALTSSCDIFQTSLLFLFIILNGYKGVHWESRISWKVEEFWLHGAAE